jgi:hypothetical protein
MSRRGGIGHVLAVAAARAAIALAAAGLVAVPSGAEAGDLAAFLTEVEEAGRAPTAARANFRVHVRRPGTSARNYEGAVAYTGADAYVEIGEPVVRVRMRGEATEVLVTGTGNEAWKPATAYDALGDGSLIVDDFRPFRAATLRTPQIVSDAKQTILVSGAPAQASPWVLVVHLFDRDKLRPIRTQYYERTINNMVRMRRDGELVRVAGVWRPRRMEIEDYRAGTSTTVELDWQPSPTLPAGLFDGAAGTLPSLRKQP